MTRTTPERRITLQRSHRRFTDAATFIEHVLSLSDSKDDSVSSITYSHTVYSTHRRRMPLGMRQAPSVTRVSGAPSRLTPHQG